MQLKDIMSHDLKTVEPNTPLTWVAEIMKVNDIGSVPVVGDETIHGIITDRDILLRTLAEGKNPMTCSAADVMTHHAEALPQDATVRDAIDVMEGRQIRRILVLDEHNRLAGIVTVGDVAARAHDISESGEVLERICAPVLLA